MLEPTNVPLPEDKSIPIHLCTEDPCPLADKECAEKLKNGFITGYTAICPECSFEVKPYPYANHSFECSKYKPVPSPTTWEDLKEKAQAYIREHGFKKIEGFSKDIKPKLAFSLGFFEALEWLKPELSLARVEEEKPLEEGKTYTGTTWTLAKDPLRWLECPHCGNTIILSTPSLIERLKKWAKNLV